MALEQLPKWRALFSRLRKTNSDFYLLQETHSTPNDEQIWRAEWGGRAIFRHGWSNSKGVAILFDRGISPAISKTIKDDVGRFIIVPLTRGDEHFTLVNVYAPTNSEPANQSALISPWFSGGDFNTQLDLVQLSTHDSQTSRPKATTGSYTQQLQILLEDYSLADIWKAKHPASKRGNFHRKAYSSSLDYIFAPEYLLLSVTSINTIPEPLSDHCIVKMELNIPDRAQGPGHWKFNNILLSDKTFIEEMTRCIREASTEQLQNPKYKGEWTKYKIRQFCIEYVTRKNIEQRNLINTLEKRVERIHKDMVRRPFTMQEFHTALKDLSNNKSPGSDGITPEFYITFCDNLQDEFYESTMFSLDQGILTQEQRSGILTLIPKKSQDRLLLNKWRPITLLNRDFKVLSTAISSRLQMCIKDVVSPDQTGFIKNRTTSKQWLTTPKCHPQQASCWQSITEKPLTLLDGSLFIMPSGASFWRIHGISCEDCFLGHKNMYLQYRFFLLGSFTSCCSPSCDAVAHPAYSSSLSNYWQF